MIRTVFLAIESFFLTDHMEYQLLYRSVSEESVLCISVIWSIRIIWLHVVFDKRLVFVQVPLFFPLRFGD